MGPQARKRKQGVRVTRKAAKHINIRVQKSIQNSEVKKLFDKSKSPRDNLRDLGLEFDLNKQVVRRNTQKPVSAKEEEKKECAAFIGLASVQQAELMTGPSYTERNPNRRKMSKFDQDYVRRNMLKHGSDYKAMERDIETNYSQHTETKMKKLCETFLKLSDSELLVPRVTIEI
jgi:predicted outer membrane protein